MAVPVEVDCNERGGALAGRVKDRRRERSVSVAEQQGERRGAAVGDRDIGRAVLVEVSRDERSRARSRRELDPVLERAVAIAEQDGDAIGQKDAAGTVRDDEIQAAVAIEVDRDQPGRSIRKAQARRRAA